VAFGSNRRGEERLVVVAESRTPDAAPAIARQVTGSIHEALGVVPEEVVIVPPGTLPKTSSGKLRRAETRRRYLAGELTDRRPTLVDRSVR
jgi:fatty-acyl-CoA synthase